MSLPRWIGVGLLAIAAAATVSVGTALVVPPTPPVETQVEVAGRLELLLPVLDELGVVFWKDTGRCRYLATADGAAFEDPSWGCGDFARFDASAAGGWQRIAAGAAGSVPSARLRSIFVINGEESVPTEGPGRYVRFIAVPQALLGQDALAANWEWRWNEVAAEPDTPGLPSHWEFRAYDYIEGMP